MSLINTESILEAARSRTEDLDAVMNSLNEFKQTLSGAEQALYGDLFEDFAERYGGMSSGSAFRNIRNGASADELLSLFSGLRDIPDLFQGRIPSGLDTIGKLEFIRDNLSPQYEAFAGTINELIDVLDKGKFRGSKLDSDMSDLISLIGNRNKVATPQPEMASASPASNSAQPTAANVDAGMQTEQPGMSGPPSAGAADLGQEIAKTGAENLRNTGSAKKSSNRGDTGGSSEGSIDGGRGGSIFEAIALALGEAMTNKLQGLLEAAEGVRSSDEDILEKSAQVTARGQELNAVSQAFNSSINSVGQAAATAGRKT